MSLSRVTRNIRSGLYFFGAAALVWFVFLSLTDTRPYLQIEVKIFGAFVAGGASFWLLRELGYFSTLRLYPRKSDLLLVMLVTPPVGLLLRTFLQGALQAPLVSARAFLLWSPLLALIIFALEYFAAGAFLGSFRRRKVVLDLLPGERENMLADFASLGINESLQFLSRNDLRKHLLSARQQEISLIIISRKAVYNFDADAILLRAHLAGIPILDHHTISADLTGRIRLNDPDQWTYILDATRQTPLLRAFSQFKIIIEPTLAVCLGLLFAPVMIALALLIKAGSPGPVFYSQTRTGYLGRKFKLLKFRSMPVDAESGGPRWSGHDDARVTPLGRFMRKTRLDELPQLWNVLKGEMSFFGPRPERPEMYKQLEREIPLFRMRTIVRPGISGWAQVCAGYAGSVEQSFSKLEYDLYYIKHMSPRLDLIILLKTLLLFFITPPAERSVPRASGKTAADAAQG